MISIEMYLGIWFVDVTAVRAFLVEVADGFDARTPTLHVVVLALVSEEFSVTADIAMPARETVYLPRVVWL